MPFLIEVQCITCKHIRSILLKDSQSSPDEEDEHCPECGNTTFVQMVGGNWVRSNDPKVRSQMLKKRSEDHSKSTFKDNLERVKDYAKKRGVKI